MTLMDAPKFDEVRDRRQRWALATTAVVLVVAFVGWWLLAGRPIDWPWTWNNHWRGTSTVNRFLKDVEKNDLAAAYGVWNHDEDWRLHTAKYAGYTFDRFQQDWSANGTANDYGTISSHKIQAARMYGNVLVVGVFLNERKSKAVFLAYDTHTHTLSFSPVELYLGP